MQSGQLFKDALIRRIAGFGFFGRRQFKLRKQDLLQLFRRGNVEFFSALFEDFGLNRLQPFVQVYGKFLKMTDV